MHKHVIYHSESNQIQSRCDNPHCKCRNQLEEIILEFANSVNLAPLVSYHYIVYPTCFGKTYQDNAVILNFFPYLGNGYTNVKEDTKFKELFGEHLSNAQCNRLEPQDHETILRKRIHCNANPEFVKRTFLYGFPLFDIWFWPGHNSYEVVILVDALHNHNTQSRNIIRTILAESSAIINSHKEVKTTKEISMSKVSETVQALATKKLSYLKGVVTRLRKEDEEREQTLEALTARITKIHAAQKSEKEKLKQYEEAITISIQAAAELAKIKAEEEALTESYNQKHAALLKEVEESKQKLESKKSELQKFAS